MNIGWLVHCKMHQDWVTTDHQVWMALSMLLLNQGYICSLRRDYPGDLNPDPCPIFIVMIVIHDNLTKKIILTL